jgi:choloylglycine hydrolase
MKDMSLKYLCLLAASIAFTLAPLHSASLACSIFTLTEGEESVYGANLDWRSEFPGQVVVNPRGTEKSVLPWEGWWPQPSDAGLVSWTSRYGSVTFTCYGRDFIEGGMNEAGLVVDEANWTATYAEPDERPGVSCQQWMQYQLDNYATVEEVLAHLDGLRPDGEGWHYLISDRTGASAVIEHSYGEAKVYSGEPLEVPALTNAGYEQLLSHIPMHVAFGGEIDIARGQDSYARFVKMAVLMRDYDAKRDGGLAGYGMAILDSVSVEETIRSIVYDSTRGRVMWKTARNGALRWLDMDSLDFEDWTRARVIDVEEGGPGDVSGFLGAYTEKSNLALVKGVLARDATNPAIIDKLKSRGLTFDDAIGIIAAHPTNTKQ